MPVPVSTTTSDPAVRRNLILALACLGQFMVVLDVAIVNVALPAMRDDLGFSPTGLQWVVNAYTLTFAGFLLLGGRAADLFGRRRMFLVGLALFTAASLVGGLAPTAGLLIIARAVQGFGAAILSPVTLTIVTTTFTEPRERARALGMWSAALASGGATGAFIGGLLTDLLSWRWIFLINLPIGIGAIIAGRAVLRESRGEMKTRSLDMPGALTITASITTLVFGVVQTTDHGWTSPWTLVPIVSSAVLLAAFVLIETRIATAPIAPLGMLRSRALAGANLAMVCVGGSMFAMWYFVSLYLQGILGFSPLGAGLCFVPAALAIIVGAQIAGRILPRFGARPVLASAALICAGGLFWMSHLSADGSYVTDILGPIILVSFGLGMSFPPGTYAATTGVPRSEAGLAAGLVNTTRQLGGAMGLAVLATVAVHRTTSLAGTEALPAAVADGYGRAIALGAVVALGAFGAAFIIPRSHRIHPTAPAPAAADPATAPSV